MRKLIATALKNTPELQAIFARRIHAASSLGRGSIPSEPKKPFIIYREFDEMPVNIAKDTAPDAVRRVFQFYIYDERGSYSRIDKGVSIVKQTVRGLEGETGDDGATCLGVVWNATSGDTEDPTYDSNMKYVTLTLTSTK